MATSSTSPRDRDKRIALGAIPQRLCGDIAKAGPLKVEAHQGGMSAAPSERQISTALVGKQRLEKLTMKGASGRKARKISAKISTGHCRPLRGEWFQADLCETAPLGRRRLRRIRSCSGTLSKRPNGIA